MSWAALCEDARAELAAWLPPDPQQERLRTAYLAHLAEHGDGLAKACRPAHLTASALVVDAEGGRVLLTLHARVRRWLQTGGHCEPDDISLRAAAAREAREESGIDGLDLLPAIARLDRHAVRCAGEPAEHLDVQFVAVAPPGARIAISAESLDLRWFPVDGLPPDADDSVRRLVAHAGALSAREAPPRTPAPPLPSA